MMGQTTTSNQDELSRYFYHYYERSTGPFMNLSDLSLIDAQSVLNALKTEHLTLAAQRREGYLERRRELEQIAKNIFISKRGAPRRNVPHYMVIGKCDWLQTWFKEGEYIRIPASAFPLDIVSFSYGDLFPTFSPRVTDNKEYRKNVYTWQEIQALIAKYGMPQEWNANGEHGPERYIEVQVWDDVPLKAYLKNAGDASEHLF